MKKILFIGAEVMPLAATGGLGDVLGSLPAAIKKADNENFDVRVVMPLYSAIGAKWREQMTLEAEYYLDLSWRHQYCGIHSLEKDGVKYYFVDNQYYFDRDTLYGQYDDGERFAFFCKAAIDMLGHIGFYPDIIHAHDWQAALSIIYLNQKYRSVGGYENIKTVFTIHNIEYQGKYDFAILGDVFDLEAEAHDILEYDGIINLMKGAIVCADKVTTVSPRYSEEICGEEHSHGLGAILRENSYKLCGILNGIDYDYYDPKNDKVISKNYTWRSLDNKYENKKALQAELGLPQENVPMIAVISRLATHKGLDLVADSIYDVLENNNVQFVVLGKGEPVYENFFRELESAYPEKARAMIMYDRDLSKRIYASADIFVMPSKSEPCGLSQMIASRYGAIPVTRETGGLFDSIKHYEEVGSKILGNGFTFYDYDPNVLKGKINESVALWFDSDKRKKFVGKIMRTDFSWNVSALKYTEMYNLL